MLSAAGRFNVRFYVWQFSWCILFRSEITDDCAAVFFYAIRLALFLSDTGNRLQDTRNRRRKESRSPADWSTQT